MEISSSVNPGVPRGVGGGGAVEVLLVSETRIKQYVLVVCVSVCVCAQAGVGYPVQLEDWPLTEGLP